MFGAVAREYYKDPANNEGKKILSVAIMPCTAKKGEILRDESKTDGIADIDYVLTTSELITMIKRSGLMFEDVELESSDMPFGIGSGAGVIFGASGGVTEAVMRRLADKHSRSEMETIRQQPECAEAKGSRRSYHLSGQGIQSRCCQRACPMPKTDPADRIRRMQL